MIQTGISDLLFIFMGVISKFWSCLSRNRRLSSSVDLQLVHVFTSEMCTKSHSRRENGNHFVCCMTNQVWLVVLEVPISKCQVKIAQCCLQLLVANMGIEPFMIVAFYISLDQILSLHMLSGAGNIILLAPLILVTCLWQFSYFCVATMGFEPFMSQAFYMGINWICSLDAYFGSYHYLFH